MKYEVPVVTNVQMWKYVQVEAETEEDAVAEVQRRLDLAEKARYSTKAVDPLIVPFMQETVVAALNDLCPLKDDELDWDLGIVGDFEPVSIDQYNDVREAEEDDQEVTAGASN